MLTQRLTPCRKLFLLELSNDGVDHSVEAEETPRLEDLNLREQFGCDLAGIPEINISNSRKISASGGTHQLAKCSPKPQKSPKGLDPASTGPIYTLQPTWFKADPEDGGVFSNTVKYPGHGGLFATMCRGSRQVSAFCDGSGFTGLVIQRLAFCSR